MDFKHVFDLKMTENVDYFFWGGVNFLNFTAIHGNKSPYSIRTRDLWVGSLNQHPLQI